MRLRLTAAAFVLLAGTAGAQEPPSLDTPVHAFKLPRQLPQCGLEAVLLRIAKDTGVPIGMERTSECGGHVGLAFPQAYQGLDLTNADVLDGLRVKEVLGRVAGLVPDYDWAIMEGVAVFRPSAAWKDTKDPLTARVPEMRFSEVPVGRIIGGILNLPADGGPKRIMSIDFAGGTVLEALNALVRMQPAMWHTTTDGQKLFVSVMSVPTGSGFSLAAPVSGLVSRRLP
jgi:hypothetical protein